jgi:antitoxin CptB
MRELDVLVEGYYLKRYEDMGEDAQAQFRALLEEADPDLVNWLLRRAPPPPEFESIIAAMRTFERDNRLEVRT